MLTVTIVNKLGKAETCRLRATAERDKDRQTRRGDKEGCLDGDTMR